MRASKVEPRPEAENPTEPQAQSSDSSAVTFTSTGMIPAVETEPSASGDSSAAQPRPSASELAFGDGPQAKGASGAGGEQLPADVRGDFEASLGTDLSSVRVHQDDAKHAGAKAYTVGQDIHFAPGQYDPQSKAGKQLLAHEVAHTQQ